MSQAQTYQYIQSNVLINSAAWSDSTEVPVRASSTTSSKNDSPLSPLPEHKLPVTASIHADSDEDDEEEDDPLPALDPVLMAKIQARHLTAKALSGSDLRFDGGSSFGKKCQVMVQPRIDPKKAETMGQKDKQSWAMRKAFDAPRVSVLAVCAFAFDCQS